MKIKKDNKELNYINLVSIDEYFRKIGHESGGIFKNNDKKGEMYERYVSIAEEKKLEPFGNNVINEIRLLKAKYPNAENILNDIEAQIYLQKISKHNFSKLHNVILIYGDPGCGKTALSNDLMSIIAPEFYRINLSMFTEAFQLCGLSMNYSTGGPGLIAKLVKDSKFANFYILLDEFDKGSTLSNSRVSSYVPLYQLLEKSTAENFEDIALNININTRYISWVLTANDLSVIPDALLSRCEIYKMRLPTKNEIYKSIAESIWKDVLSENNLIFRFNNRLSNEVKDLLAEQVAPRTIKSVLNKAIAYAVMRVIKSGNNEKDITLKVEDLYTTNSFNNSEIKMGFI